MHPYANAGGDSGDGMLPSIKEKACAVGADAVVIKSSTLPTQKQPAQAYVVAIKFL